MGQAMFHHRPQPTQPYTHRRPCSQQGFHYIPPLHCQGTANRVPAIAVWLPVPVIDPLTQVECVCERNVHHNTVSRVASCLQGANITFTIQRGEGAEIGEAAELCVYTTRPDTLFGVTYMVVAPEHPLLQSMVGWVRHALDSQYTSVHEKS